MRNTILLISLCLIASFAVATNTALLQNLKKFSATEFGKTLINTIELEMMTSEDPRPIIINLLEELKQQNLDAQASADEQIASTRGFCASESSRLDQEITSAKNSLTEDNAELINQEAALIEKKETLGFREETLKNLEAELKAATESRQKNLELYTSKEAKFSKILAVLREVRAQISQRANSRYNTAFLEKKDSLSLVQLKATVTSELTEMKGWGKMINFLASKIETHLTQSPDDVADEGFSNILTIIDDLIRKFEQEHAANEKWNNEDLAIYQEAYDRLHPEIIRLSEEVSTLKVLISGTEGRVAELKINISTNEQLVERKETELGLLRASCDASEKSYAEGTSARFEELDIIEKVLRIVREELSGRREINENAIKGTVIGDEYTNKQTGELAEEENQDFITD